ncbi:MAG: DNA repair protein RecO C-terminal domain-containing protein [Spirochaetaceae bacterium]|nr:DNA repair protein RecO C-terminal domain-containing protein [Spirochaetaceae bacterium]
MQRHYEYEAIVLKISNVGDGHTLIDFLVCADGDTKLISAFFFGARKTKKHYGIQQFQTGLVWLYYNPIQGLYKCTDFKATATRVGLTENLKRIWCASFVSELSIKMSGNISWQLVNAFFDGIALSSETECVHAILRFLWRVIYANGLAPELLYCASCGHEFISDKSISYFNTVESSFFCSNCISITESKYFFSLSDESRNFLSAIIMLKPSESRKIILNETSKQELKTFLFFLIQQLVGGTFNTLSMPMI